MHCTDSTAGVRFPPPPPSISIEPCRFLENAANFPLACYAASVYTFKMGAIQYIQNADRVSLTQEQRRAISDRRMLDAATTLIARQGFGATSLTQIGVEAGYSRGLAGYRFGSKDQLCQELLADMVERIGREFVDPALGDKRGLEAIIAFCSAYFTAVISEPETVRAYMQLKAESLCSLKQLQPLFIESGRTFIQRLSAYIAEGWDDGTIRKTASPKIQAATIGALLSGVTSQSLMDPEEYNVTELQYEIVESIRAALAV